MKLEPFSDLFDFMPKSKIKAGDGLSEGIYPLYTSSAVQSKFFNECQFEKDSLIFGTGGNASVHISDSKFAVSTDCLVAQSKNQDRVLVRFVYYFLSGNIRLLEEGFKGAGLKHISKSYISNLKIPISLLEEQRRIVEILDAAQKLIDQRKEQIALMDQLVQSLFYDMFGDSWLNGMGWPTSTLSGIVREGKIITYGIVQAGEHVPGGVPYIKTSDIKENRISGDKLQCTSIEIADSYERSKCAAGDIIMSIRATVGTVAFLPKKLDGANLTQGTARISVDVSKASPKYIFHALLSKGVQLKISRQTKGATFKEITLSRLRDVEVPLPPLHLQTEFAERVEIIESQKTAMATSLSELKDTFNALMQRAFKGELV